MSLCLFSRRVRTVDAMSFGDIGGNGPPHHSNQLPMPHSQQVQSVKRRLFGPVDHIQTKQDLDDELRRCELDSMHTYNFDFTRELPLNGPSARFDWQQCSDHSDSEVTHQQITSTKHDVIVAPISQSTPTLSTTDSTTDPSLASTSDATSVTIPVDSKPVASPSSTSSLHIDASDANKSDIRVKMTKQSKITAFLRGRKSGENERKRSGAKSASHEDRLPAKRHRPDASPSAVTAAQVIDTAVCDGDEEQESVQT